MEQYCIGFANDYFTLWSSTTNVKIEDRKKYNITSYTFIKNLSTDKTKAFEMAPEGTIYDKNLNGFTENLECKYFFKLGADRFHFGKYKGIRFIDCNDYTYLAWYYTECGNNIQREYIKEVLDYCDCLKFYNGKYYSLEGYNKIMASKNIFDYHSKVVDNKEDIVVDITSNIDGGGNYYDKSTGFKYRFEKIKGNCYQGSVYYLPLDNKGNAKRIKGKKIVITNYEKIGDNLIKIIEWNIQK